MINQDLIPIARALSVALLAGKQLQFKDYVGSESTAAYDITVAHEAYDDFKKRKLVAADKLRDITPLTPEQTQARADLLLDWEGKKEAGAYRGPVYHPLVIEEEDFGGCIYFYPDKPDRIYVRDIREQSKVLVGGTEKVTKSRQVTLEKERYTELILDEGKPHLFQLTVRTSQIIKVL